MMKNIVFIFTVKYASTVTYPAYYLVMSNIKQNISRSASFGMKSKSNWRLLRPNLKTKFVVYVWKEFGKNLWLVDSVSDFCLIASIYSA